MAALLGVVAIAATVTACSDKTINYRLTLSVEVDGVVHTGSGVIETKWTHSNHLDAVPWHVGVRGEAIVVDLGLRGKLFMLLTPDELRYESRAPGFLLLTSDDDFDAGIPVPSRIAARKGVVNVPLAALPLLVRFRDVRSLDTVERVDPSHLETAFGPGVKIIGASLIVTDEAVSTGIDRQLPWLDSTYRGKGLSIISSDSPLADKLGLLAFKRERNL